jgi:2-hydroxychromene-2-carboxylate isomerase
MPDPEPLWYFAYGSNMSPAIFTERRGIRPLAVRRGWVDGYRLCFDLPIGSGERACANIALDDDARVAGVLYAITPEAAEHLDRTEGVPQGVYARVAVSVAVESTERIAAFTYQSALRRPGRRPSARYIGLLLDGARIHGLPPEYQSWLEGFDLAYDERTAPEGTIEARRVRFYFAYNSPYAFLASTRLGRELAPLGVAIDYKPIYSPRTGSAPDMATPRMRYVREDVARFADAYGLVLNPGPFADTRRACLGFVFARSEGRALAYHHAVSAARFLEGRDIGDVDTLAAIAERAGLRASRFLAALDDPRWTAALARNSEDAAADDVFGFPFFVFGEQRFWGNDRIDALVRAIQLA